MSGHKMFEISSSVRFGSVRFGSVRFGTGRVGSGRLGSGLVGSLYRFLIALGRVGSSHLGPTPSPDRIREPTLEN